MTEARKAGRRCDGATPIDAGVRLAETLSQRYRAPLMAFFRRRTGNFEEAEDLAQEVLLRVVRRNARLAVETPDSFIFETARNLLRDRARHTSVVDRYRTEVEFGQEHTEAIAPERILQGKQELETIMTALMKLSEKTRDMFILNRLEGMKYRDIADLYGISVSAVEKHLIKALAHVMELSDRS